MKKLKAANLMLCLLAVLCLTGCVSRYSGNYDKGIKAFSAGDYDTAAQIFDNCDPAYGNSAAYAAYSHGLVLWEQGRYTEAKPYFEQTQGFMYGTKRYRYCSACELLENGQFGEAAAIFLKLEDFENAPAMYQYAIARQAEAGKDYGAALAAYDSAGNVLDAQDRLLNLQTQVYSKAIELFNAGDLSNALELFNFLGDYLSAEDYAVQCRNVNRDDLYARGESQIKAGDLQAAYRTFTSLGSYRDAAERATELAGKLGIPVIDESDPYANEE